MHVLLTGSTGLLGQYLLRDLLLAGQPVAALVRAQENESAQDRVNRILKHWEHELGRTLPRPKVLEGDIGSENLCLSAEDRTWVQGNCRTVLHNAASLSFVGADRSAEPWRSNYGGTAHLLEFCRTVGLREYHHMSTAFVCGQRTGVVEESDLDEGQSYRNDYEHSKCEAEKLVHASAFLNKVTVYRPAVIIGDYRTGVTTTYHGLYSYLQFAKLMTQMLSPDADGKVHLPLRFTHTGDEPRNLVPVDWVSAATTQIFLNSAHHGKTYHLTPGTPITIRGLRDFMLEYFNVYGPTFVGGDKLDPATMNEFEKMFYDYSERYEGYWGREPIFDATNTQTAAPSLPCPEIDFDCLRRMTDFAVKDRFGKARKASKRQDAAV